MVDVVHDLVGLDSDNGGERLYTYCQRNEITFTRSRPYKKNDNAHVEQKNWTVVRRLVGVFDPGRPVQA